jgi:hypothetical protein
MEPNYGLGLPSRERLSQIVHMYGRITGTD